MLGTCVGTQKVDAWALQPRPQNVTNRTQQKSSHLALFLDRAEVEIVVLLVLLPGVDENNMRTGIVIHC